MRGHRAGVRQLAAVLVAFVGAVAVPLVVASPAHAAGELALDRMSVSCTDESNAKELVWWGLMSHVGSTGTITAISVSPAGTVYQGTNFYVGAKVDQVNGYGVNVEYAFPPGNATGSLTISVHWDTANGPLDVTVTDALALPVCVAKPSVTFAVQCPYNVTVTLHNGPNAWITAYFAISGGNSLGPPPAVAGAVENVAVGPNTQVSRPMIMVLGSPIVVSSGGVVLGTVRGESCILPPDGPRPQGPPGTGQAASAGPASAQATPGALDAAGKVPSVDASGSPLPGAGAGLANPTRPVAATHSSGRIRVAALALIGVVLCLAMVIIPLTLRLRRVRMASAAASQDPPA
jgi:hypothetical protein